MNNPYEALGVLRDATPDEIKKAYQRAASANHPDRAEGDQAKMAEINEAYAILSDPESRARFDALGVTVQPPSLDQGATNTLLQLFTQLLDVNQGKMLLFAGSSIKASKEQAEAAVYKMKARITALTARREAITVTEGVTNLVHGLIDQQIQGMTQNIANAEHGIAVFTRAGELLEAYSSSEQEFIQPTQYGVTGSTGGVLFYQSR
jgi:hypothetical protein